MLGYVNQTDPIYQNTRRFILSRDNPYYMIGLVINGYYCPFPLPLASLRRQLPM